MAAALGLLPARRRHTISPMYPTDPLTAWCALIRCVEGHGGLATAPSEFAPNLARKVCVLGACLWGFLSGPLRVDCCGKCPSLLPSTIVLHYAPPNAA